MWNPIDYITNYSLLTTISIMQFIISNGLGHFVSNLPSTDYSFYDAEDKNQDVIAGTIVYHCCKSDIVFSISY